jgi:hypothetical protein
LGETGKVQLLLDAWSPLVLTRAPKAVPALRVEVPEEVQAGNPLMITLRGDALLPEGTGRVIRFEFTAPGGELYDLYSRNVQVEAATHQERFDFAYNDPKGQWHLAAHDLVTGRVMPATFGLQG